MSTLFQASPGGAWEGPCRDRTGPLGQKALERLGAKWRYPFLTQLSVLCPESQTPTLCFGLEVYIVLRGENGSSEPRELYCPEKPLFERNSRHTFVLR